MLLPQLPLEEPPQGRSLHEPPPAAAIARAMVAFKTPPPCPHAHTVPAHVTAKSSGYTWRHAPPSSTCHRHSPPCPDCWDPNWCCRLPQPTWHPVPTLPSSHSQSKHPVPLPLLASSSQQGLRPAQPASLPGSQPETAETAGTGQLGGCYARPFTIADVAAHCRRLKGHKAVAGSVPPWYLQQAGTQLAHVLAATFNAWVRIGQAHSASSTPSPSQAHHPAALAGCAALQWAACQPSCLPASWSSAFPTAQKPAAAGQPGGLVFGGGAAQRKRRGFCAPCKACTAA